MNKKDLFTLPLLYFTILSFLCACTPGTKTATNEAREKNAPFNKLLAQYYEESLHLSPVVATFNGDNRFNDQWPNDISKTYNAKYKTFYQKYLDSLGHYDKNTLDHNDKVSYDLLAFDLQTNMEGLAFPESDQMPINQIFSNTLLFAQLGSGVSIQPFATTKDYDNFLKRIDGFVVWCDTAVANMKEGIADGYVLPKALVVKMIPQMKSFINEDVTKSVFYGPISKLPASFSKADKDKYTKEYSEAIKTKLVPSYSRLYTFLSKEYLPKSRSTSGVGALKNGKDYYNWCIKYYTTTTLSPDSIFNLGLQQVAMITKGMDIIRVATKFKGDLPAFLKYIRTDSKFKPFKTDKEILDAFQHIYDKEKPYLKKLFGKQPKTRFEIRKTEDFRAASAALGEYYPGTPDGKRPGIFYTAILDPKKYLSPEMETLFLHEAIPGHHFQISLQTENTDLPEFRKFYGNSAYAEGWALYSESLGKDLGEYTDPYMLLGHLGDDMHRAIRLVVDAGLHAKGWSREKAIAYMLANEPTSEHEAEAEIERYMAAPGQALSYKIGSLSIRALRDKYEKELGSKFNIAAFHDAILASGNLPMEVMKENMADWAASYK